MAKDIKREKELKAFVEYWTNKGDEKQDMQNFWRSLVKILADIDAPEKYLQFEKPVLIGGKQKYIDCYIGATKVLIEQKSLGVNLAEKKKQSDGAELSPFGQAHRYNSFLPYDDRAKYIITSNFAEIWIYDLNRFSPEKDVAKINLTDLVKEAYRLKFIANPAAALLDKQVEISLKAGGYVEKIYNALAKEYKNPDSEEAQKSLNILCVRLIFCLYAEDAEVFENDQFMNFVAPIDPDDLRDEIIKLFKILDTPTEQRDPYLKKSLKNFPYVNGGLFAAENIEIPNFTEEIKNTLLDASGYDWAEINPTIFGAVFESTLNPQTRRSGGMHYTSVENIHKVIDPLFLDDLKIEYKNIINTDTTKKERAARLRQLQEKLASLTFLENQFKSSIQSAAA